MEVNVLDVGSKDNYRGARLFTRLGLFLLLSITTYAAVNFCYTVYFDRYTVFNDAVTCAVDILNEHNITFWLRNGTLLGATRMGNLILWDSDLSFGVAQESEKINVAFEELRRSCFSRTFYTDGNELPKWRMCNNNICAVFDEAKLDGKTVRTASGESCVKELFPLKECVLMDVKAFCPQNSTYYLQSAFGRNWLTTPFMELFGGNSTR